jgi:hypothetical protein
MNPGTVEQGGNGPHFFGNKKIPNKIQALEGYPPPPPHTHTLKQALQSLEWYNVSNINCMLIIVGTKHFASQCRPIGRQKVEAKMFRFHNSLRKSQLDVLEEIYSYIMVAQVSNKSSNALVKREQINRVA